MKKDKTNGTRYRNVTMGGALLYPTEYMSAVEFRGQDVNLTIKMARKEELPTEDGDKVAKEILYFVETDKKLVACRTSMRKIAAVLELTETDRWPGHRITLFPTTCLCFGNTVDCIRVRDSKPGIKPSGDKLTDEEMDAVRAQEADESAKQQTMLGTEKSQGAFS